MHNVIIVAEQKTSKFGNDTGAIKIEWVRWIFLKILLTGGRTRTWNANHDTGVHVQEGF